MTTPTRGVQVEIVCNELEPIRVVRKHKPRHGGRTLAVFTHQDGRGVERARAYIEEKGHKLA